MDALRYAGQAWSTGKLAAAAEGGQQANLDAFTELQWVTVNQEPGSYPF
jgi:hypothetical protein